MAISSEAFRDALRHFPSGVTVVTIKSGEVPVFWACGVTPMEAIIRAKLDVAITHEPGHMLVTDMRDESLRSSSATCPQD